MSDEDLVYRLRKRAEIRRSIPTRKSIQEGKPDRIAALLDEAADRIEDLADQVGYYEDPEDLVSEEYLEQLEWQEHQEETRGDRFD